MAKKPNIDRIITFALEEDIQKGDITTQILVSPQRIAEAVIIFRENAVVCGLEVAKGVFRKLDKNAVFKSRYRDGSRVPANTKILQVKAKARAILIGERVALNFLGHLSAIATKTDSFVKKIRPFKAKIMDTRKTTPGLRALEKEAVRYGGGISHRYSLSDMVLIKDNHWAMLDHQTPIGMIVKHAKRLTKKPVEVEVENLRQFRKVLQAQPDYILLDNMSIQQIRKAVILNKNIYRKHRPQLEVSGRVNLKTVRAIAKTGVDRISIGELTHTKKTVDVTLEIVS